MGRIEALTRALNSLRKVGIRTRTESEDGDGFGRWSGLGAADKLIGTSKATVYASLAGRNRASDVWRQRAQFDDDYQQFLATQREDKAQGAEEGKGMDHLIEHEHHRCSSPQQQQQQQQKRKQKLPLKQRSQSQIDTEAQKRRFRHSSVTLYAVDVCDTRGPGRQGGLGPESTSIRVCQAEPSSTPSTPESGAWMSPAVSGGSAATLRQVPPLPLPLGHVSRARTSGDSAAVAAAAGMLGLSCSSSSSSTGCGANIVNPRNGGGTATAASAVMAVSPAPSTPGFTSGQQSTSPLLLRSSNGTAATIESGGVNGIDGSGGGSSLGSCSCGSGGPNGGSANTPQHQHSTVASGGSLIRRQGSTVNAVDLANAAAAALAASGSNSSMTSCTSTVSSSFVRLPSLRQMPQTPQLNTSCKALRPATLAACSTSTGVSTTNDGGARQQHQQQQPPQAAAQPPTQGAILTQTSQMHHQSPAAVLQHQQQQQQQQQQKYSQKPASASEQPRLTGSAGDFRDGRGRERQATGNASSFSVSTGGPLGSRRAGSTAGLPSVAPGAATTTAAAPSGSVAAAHPAALPRGFSTQSLITMLAAAGGSAGSMGSCGGVSSSSCAGGGSNTGRETPTGNTRSDPAATVVAGLTNLDDAIPFDIVEGTGRWFDAGDPSYCNPDCDDEMAQILDELVQSGRVESGSGSVLGGGIFIRGTGTIGRPQSGLSSGLTTGGGCGVPDAAVAVVTGPSTPRPILGAVGSASSRRFGSTDLTTSQLLSEVGSLPAIQGSGASSTAAVASRRGGVAAAASTASVSVPATSLTAFGGGGGGGGGSGSCRGSDSLLPRLPWAGNAYGNVFGGSCAPGSPGGLASPSVTTATNAVATTAAVAYIGSSISPCASPRNFISSYNPCGNGGIISVELDARAGADATEDVAVTSSTAVAVAAGGCMRHPTQSFRRSSQLLIQAAGRRASAGLQPNMMAAAAGAAAAAGVGGGGGGGPFPVLAHQFSEPNQSRTAYSSGGGIVEARP